MMPLEKRTRLRRNESQDVVAKVIRALNRLEGVRVVRNPNLGPVVPWAHRNDPAAHPITAGLGTGSPDIVGVVKFKVVDLYNSDLDIGRAFALEAKLPAQYIRGADGITKHMPAGVVKPEQDSWMRAFRSLGGFVCVVHSVEEALAAVDRCRRGALE